jgi:hypothetical protein
MHRSVCQCRTRRKAGLNPLPLLLAVLLLAGCGRPMSSSRYAEFLTDSHAYLTQRQARLDALYGIGGCDRYDWDQETGQIVFSDSGVARVVADVQFVGSISSRSGTWLWAWDNPTISTGLTRAARRVRRFGEQRRIRRLTEATWPADEVDGWEMTSIAARLTQAEGAYRSPGENGAAFLLLANVRPAAEAAPINDGRTIACGARATRLLPDGRYEAVSEPL